ncbi:MAG: ATP-binding cassette, subfamily B [Chloroflexi bacterium]|jgi:ATP-binding cassette subfamily B protein|nr:MAG: ATP-binding cassette, subfamily B [Chloroflexota bacterium]
MHVLWRIVKRASKYKLELTFAYTTILGVTAASMLIPRFLGTTIDEVLSSGSQRELLMLGLAVLAANALRGAFAYWQQYLGETIGQKVAYDLRNEFYDHLQRMSFGFHDKQQTGNLMSKATTDMEGIRMFVQMGLIRAAFTVLLFLGVGTAMVLLDWQLALISLLFTPVIAWRSGQTMVQMRRVWLLVQTELGLMTTALQENLSGQRVVKAFAAEKHEQSRFYYHADNVSRYSYHAAIYQASNSSLVTFFYVSITVLILWAGGRQVIEGTLSHGELAQFIFYLGILTQPVRMIAWVVNSFSRGYGSGQRLFATLDAVSPVQNMPDAVDLLRVKGHVQFESVSFAYDGTTPVLSNIDIDAKPSKVIALVGAPGSGKSTLVHLIPRFYDATSGTVRIDGHDVRDVTTDSLRRNIGIVQQDVFLFTSNIRDNIAYGKINASEDEIINASKIAQLHDFIKAMPDGYNTWVGERGTTLSGGQRQRLAIARTVLLDPPILILDDSTASVDTETEHHIREALQHVMKGRTTFVIAHRLSTVLSADLILVFNNGEIVQRGTHQELIELPGHYQDIYNLQFRPEMTDVTNSQLGSTANKLANEPITEKDHGP